MSQRPSASRPASRSPPEGQGSVLPPVQLRDDTQREGQPAERQRPGSDSRGLLPPLHTSPQEARIAQAIPSGEDWRATRQSRDLGVHSILNPPEPERASSAGHRLSGGATESPLPAPGPPPPFRASPSLGPTHTFPGQYPSSGTPPTEAYGGSYFGPPRRILTPRSPAARTVSAGRGMGHTTIDAHQSPFAPSRGRSYRVEPGPYASSEVPPMPSPPVHFQQQQQHYGFPPPASTSTNPPLRSSGTMQAPARTPLSQSASPSISASSHNPAPSQTSPASMSYHTGGQPPPTSSSYFPGSSFSTAMQQQGGGLQFQGRSSVPASTYTAPAPPTSSSASSSRQTSTSDSVQVLTITTLEGEQINVPVDVHHASRLADEKRARNAGASARFRSRRKEKEKEANVSIEKLHQQGRDLERKVRDLEQERDRYRHDRDRLRDLVYRTPDTSHLALQGPPSPYTLSTGAYQRMGQLEGPPPPPQMGYQRPEPLSERPPRRRRTETQGEFTGAPYTLPPASTLPPVQAPGYPPSLSGAPPSLPPIRIDNSSAQQTPNPNTTPSTSAGPPPPFDPHVRGYDRAWPGGPERR